MMDGLLSYLPRMSNEGTINILSRSPEDRSPAELVEDDEDHLGIDYRPYGEEFEILISNRTSQDIKHVLLHFLFADQRERHRWYARRPLYRKDAESKAFGMTDYLEANEREVKFLVNKTGEISSDGFGDWRRESDSNPLIEWIEKNNGSRRKMYGLAKIAYKFQGGEERMQIIDRLFRFDLQLMELDDYNLTDVLQNEIEKSSLSQHEYDSIYGVNGTVFMGHKEVFSP